MLLKRKIRVLFFSSLFITMNYGIAEGWYTRWHKVERADTFPLFKDLKGDSSESVNLLQAVVNYIAKPGKLLKTHAIPHKAYFFIGPARSGKSFNVYALFNEIRKRCKMKVKIMHLHMIDLMKKDRGIARIVKEAKANTPSVLCFNELNVSLLSPQELQEFLAGIKEIIAAQNAHKPIILIVIADRPESALFMEDVFKEADLLSHFKKIYFNKKFF